MKTAKDIVMRYAMKLTQQITSEIDNIYQAGSGFGYLWVADGYSKLAEKLLDARGFRMSVIKDGVGCTKYIIRPKNTECIGD